MYSVVIPVYNAKSSLKRCVDSWLAQSRSDLELLLVDDGSKMEVPDFVMNWQTAIQESV